ncbi:MAG TPA: SMP-30/gluconolactonase/LRE family protein [Paludibacteraceae bacterium]|nr:SMP-30/gluconolactonase/LRE family protein [Paludibacteraceae bacterium]HQF51217.1 SMP-30/gluconolactonase/LRE family protein [Paludibacteraceae bacterium]HQJ91010.1 SMP-30/gluconolactonase/LRE family protein [Paludibacteraceae bacterium]
MNLIDLLKIGCASALLSSCSGSGTTPQKEVVEMKDSVKIWDAEVVYRTNALLGEGALWHDGQLYWLDIENKELHFLSYKNGEVQDKKYILPVKPGTVVPFKDGVILAMTDGIYRMTIAGADTTLTKLAENPELSIGSRYNDGKCDAAGRLWVGTYADEKKQCALYRFSNEGEPPKMLDGVVNSNGICWSPDGTKMYYIDTPTLTVQEFDFDEKNGEISNGHVIIRFPQGVGTPDGSTIDEEGMLWIAHWGGACVSRWNPQTGEMIGKVNVLTRDITSVAFGGDDLGTLFITTVSAWVPDSVKARYPDSGSLFAIKPGVKGLPSKVFAY